MMLKKGFKKITFSLFATGFFSLALVLGCDNGPISGPIPLDPLIIPKYVEPLIVPPVMAPSQQQTGLTSYQIAVRQFSQQVLPKDFPTTTVWGYGQASDPLPGSGQPSSFNYPAFTIEARSNEKVQVQWINDLVDDDGNFLPHLFAVDQTLHWANPPGPPDSHGTDPTPYLGPVPIVTHLHGSHVAAVSDGHPEAWFLPNANDIPPGFSTQGTHYGSVSPVGPGAALFEYMNDQRATTLWYHDHTLGMTRLNVYAGLAGFYLLRDDAEEALDLPGPAPKLGDPPGTKYFEIPVAIQDRSFNGDGSLFYPDSRSFFDDFPGPFAPEGLVPPIWNPEVFGNTIVVNGKTWPFLEVEPRLYRFRFLNGANARFFILKFNQAGLIFHQIGNEGGLLPDQPVELEELEMAPAERADVLVDFSGLSEGEEVILLNVGPDEPFQGSEADQDPANPETTGQVMMFKVVALTNQGNPGQIPASLPPITPLGPSAQTRDLTLNEMVIDPGDFPFEAELGTLSEGPLSWDEPISEFPMLGDIETWQIINLTGDAHPIHLHLVHFEVIERIPIDVDALIEAQMAFLQGEGPLPVLSDYFIGGPVPPNSWESGTKDTVNAPPGFVTRIKAVFDLAGLYVWHCHILEHEDNEMMRNYEVLAP